MCDSQTGVCKNCRPGTKGNYCEKCIDNVLEPACDRCVPGYWGLYTQKNGCKRKAFFSQFISFMKSCKQLDRIL